MAEDDGSSGTLTLFALACTAVQTAAALGELEPGAALAAWLLLMGCFVVLLAGRAACRRQDVTTWVQPNLARIWHASNRRAFN
jgi:hypothetical protein